MTKYPKLIHTQVINLSISMFYAIQLPKRWIRKSWFFVFKNSIISAYFLRANFNEAGAKNALRISESIQEKLTARTAPKKNGQNMDRNVKPYQRKG